MPCFPSPIVNGGSSDKSKTDLSAGQSNVALAESEALAKSEAFAKAEN
jgi:hypothetical protein